VVVFEGKLVNLRLYVGPDDSWSFLQKISFNFVVEMPDVSHNSVVFHFSHVFQSDDSHVSSCSNENIDFLNDVFDSHNFVALHASLKSADRVTLSDVDSRTTASHSLGTSLSNVSETAD